MDGIHDLGGKEGFGKVDVHEPEEPFHADWEGRVLGIVRSMSRADDWSLDWFRFCRELIDPVDYLTRSYYDQWIQTYAAMMVNSGMASVTEIASGKTETNKTNKLEFPGRISPPQSVMNFSRDAKVETRYDRPYDGKPRFKVGDAVTTQGHGKSGHTRLPAYARNKSGLIHAFRGVHVFPDDMALGLETAQPLYTVSFDARELWVDESSANETVYLDLWESYLV